MFEVCRPCGIATDVTSGATDRSCKLNENLGSHLEIFSDTEGENNQIVSKTADTDKETAVLFRSDLNDAPELH